jgi:multidrug resistance efflux pump
MAEISVQQAEAELAELGEEPDPLLALQVQHAEQQLDWLADDADSLAAKDVERTQLIVAQLELQLQKKKLWAPFDGTIVAVSVHPNDTVSHQQPAILLADLDHFQLEVDSLSQYDVTRVSVGQPAAVTLDAFPDTVLAGRVSEIALQESTDQDDSVSYAVSITVDTPPQAAARLRWGMTGIARMKLPSTPSNVGDGK